MGSCQDTYIDPRKVIGRILFLVTAECLAGSSSQWAYRFRNLSSLVMAVA